MRFKKNTSKYQNTDRAKDNNETFLPSYQPDKIYPDTEWHKISGKAFVDFINRTYDDIIHWREKLFKVPAGKASRFN